MPVPCARCRTPLPAWELASGDSAVCTLCGAANRVRVFPVALETGAEARPEAALAGEAACFDHPSKRAVAACSQCGRFVCRLCSVEFGGAVWCPACVAAGAGRARAAKLADLLKDAGITTIYVTQWQRTAETAKPLAERLKITMQPLTAADTATIVARVRAAAPTDRVLVVAHGDTLPVLLKELGYPEPVTIGDQEFDSLFVLVPRDKQAAVGVRLRYGNEDTRAPGKR